ncbi:tripartite tricarboxylate transporter TctB family protein [Salibacterium qingdaonense]|uniref:Putative tricarboxylic transport membrane protein n=1 Tax=Salibacterium qingdaonense TaxID=266892 RepID=A0A1I4MBD6_9BACI|nr:tripartite tricarboxylate transporter TctB family protein [Salibacterium qingdaonense]SFM00539.1 putative tricarboxylic transport membrane protein [Salibacterium qingdaonense]
MLKPVHRKASLFLIALAVFYLILAYRLESFTAGPIGADTMPKILGWLLILLSVILFFFKDQETEEEKQSRRIAKNDLIKMAGVLLLTFCYIFLLERVGFIVTSFLFIWLCSWFLGYQKHVKNIVTAVLFPVVLYSLFTFMLGIALPSGILPF